MTRPSRNAAAVSLLCACAALTLILADEWLPPFIPTIAGLLVCCALVAAASALLLQQRQHASRRVRRRLAAALPLALLSAALLAANFLQTPSDSGASSTTDNVEIPDAESGDKLAAVFTDGWHGEARQHGLLAIAHSFEEHAPQSRRFNAHTRRPVAYATLTVINQEYHAPVLLETSATVVMLTDGTTVKCFDTADVLKNVPRETLAGVSLDRQPLLAPGEMAAEIPICLPRDFDWRQARSIRLATSAGEITINGTLLTADAKKELFLTVPETAQDASIPPDGASAGDWYKDL